MTAFDDFPLDSVERKAELFAQAADEDWHVVLSHEREHPVGRLVRDRDRFRVRADLSDATGDGDPDGAGLPGRIASISAVAPCSSTGPLDDLLDDAVRCR